MFSHTIKQDSRSGLFNTNTRLEVERDGRTVETEIKLTKHWRISVRRKGKRVNLTMKLPGQPND